MSTAAEVLSGAARWSCEAADCLDYLRRLPDGCVQTCVTSPPYYGLRDYGVPGQLGLEPTPAEYVERLVEVFREVKRVLRDDGTAWVNLGDSYAASCQGNKNGQGASGLKRDAQMARGHRSEESRRRSNDRTAAGLSVAGVARSVPAGHKPKDLLGIPWTVALALRADGWYLRSDIIWSKPNPMPESVSDRPTKAHEYVFLLSKSPRYFWDGEAISEPSTYAGQVTPFGNRDADARCVERLTGNMAPGMVYETPATRNRRSVWSWDDHRALLDWLAENEPDTLARFLAESESARSVWEVTPQPFRGAHFAVMPPELVRPCVLAGSPSAGCCAACGAPRVRVVEREPTGRVYGRGDCPADHRAPGTPQRTGAGSGALSVRTTTLGWEPSCACNADTAPSVVLDPFAGSGTTLAVAVEENRRVLGCELNPRYIRLVERRLRGVTPSLVGG